MFKIGDFSKLTCVTVKALRLYDSLGLLTPAKVEPSSGYRYYTSAQLPRLHRILALKDLGFSLEQISQLLDADLSSAQLTEMLRARQEDVLRLVESEQARLDRIAARLRAIEEDSTAQLDVVVKSVEPTRVASVRGLLPSHDAIGTLYRRLLAYAGRHAVQPAGITIIWHDTEHRDEQIDAEATLTSNGPLPDDEAVTVYDLPNVETMACVVYQGAPDAIGIACEALLRWAERTNYRIDGPERVVALQPFHPGMRDVVVELQLPVVRAEAGSG